MPEQLRVCSFFLAVNIMISWFVLTLELSARLQYTRQASAAIGVRWKTSRQIYEQIPALKEFP